MRNEDSDRCPLCGPTRLYPDSSGFLNCNICGWVDESSALVGSSPIPQNGAPTHSHSQLSIRSGRFPNSDLNLLSPTQRRRAAKIQTTQILTDRRDKSVNEDVMVIRVISIIRNYFLSEHDVSVRESISDRVKGNLRNLRRIESTSSDLRIFRSGCMFGAEAAAIIMMELIDRENGVIPPDTNRRIFQIIGSINLEKPQQKKLKRAIVRTRRSIKSLLVLDLPNGELPRGNWNSLVIRQFLGVEEFNLLYSGADNIISRKISDSDTLRFEDRREIIGTLQLMIEGPSASELYGLSLNTVVDIAILLSMAPRNPGMTLKKLSGFLGIPCSALNHTSKVRCHLGTLEKKIKLH